MSFLYSLYNYPCNHELFVEFLSTSIPVKINENAVQAYNMKRKRSYLSASVM